MDLKEKQSSAECERSWLKVLIGFWLAHSITEIAEYINSHQGLNFRYDFLPHWAWDQHAINPET